MRAALTITAIVILGSAASAEAQSNTSRTVEPPVLTAPPPAPPPSLPSGKSRPASPLGNPANWVTADDYPSRALREQREGTTGFRAVIGPDGRPTGCAVTSSSGSADLDAVTCQLIVNRALFKPALDFKGKPTTGSYSSRVRWVMPDTPIRIDPSDRVMTFIVEPDGSATNCVEKRDGVIVDDPSTKSPCLADAKMAPFKDASGRPVRKQVTVQFSVTVSDPPK